MINYLHFYKELIIFNIEELYKEIDKCNLDNDDKEMIKAHLDMYIALISKEEIEYDI